MRRIFWMAVGAGATVWTINKANRVARSLTPGSLAEGAALGSLEVGRAVRHFKDEVKAGMLQRELELNRQLGLDGSVLATPGYTEDARVLRAAAVRSALPPGSAPASAEPIDRAPLELQSHPTITFDRNEDL
ncbi:DUF6167 family protein [Streptacidiphilus jiangxiensis]|uniref:Secreted protein n=1 Tax=Streptacidiphilus jiangxiensis TaxID=235985 RepID=A0A1H7YM60_STRJI|nr:DUF6167 family protein [Streptacidiphilus jiangxiensis]SEM47200.1 hypothetical protein SAMN05414137_12974 [Streptacidiphilus jiangxiensis]